MLDVGRYVRDDKVYFEKSCLEIQRLHRLPYLFTQGLQRYAKARMGPRTTSILRKNAIAKCQTQNGLSLVLVYMCKVRLCTIEGIR